VTGQTGDFGRKKKHSIVESKLIDSNGEQEESFGSRIWVQCPKVNQEPWTWRVKKKEYQRREKRTCKSACEGGKKLQQESWGCHPKKKKITH